MLVRCYYDICIHLTVCVGGAKLKPQTVTIATATSAKPTLENSTKGSTSSASSTLQPHLPDECHSYSTTWSRLSSSQKSSLGKHLIVNENAKLVYCPAPYHSMTPWMKAMYYLNNHSLDYADHAKIPANVANDKNNHKHLADYTPEQQVDILSTYRKFLVVRHPLTRLVVVYLLKFKAYNPTFARAYGQYIVQKYRPGASPDSAGNDVTFAEFIRYISDTKELDTMNEHWRPLEHLCRHCAIHYDYIVHFENMAEESKKMFQHFNLPLSTPIQPDHWEIIPGSQVKQFFNEIQPSMLLNLVKQYVKDVNLFEYNALV